MGKASLPKADFATIYFVVLSATAFSAVQGLTFPLISIALESARVSPTLSGLNAGVYALGLATTTAMTSHLSRRFQPDFLILLGLIGASFTLALFALTSVLWIWFIARFALGFFSNLILIISEVWLQAACTDRMRGRVSGFYGMCISAGFALGPLGIPLWRGNTDLVFASSSAYLALVAFVVFYFCGRTSVARIATPWAAFLLFFRHAPLHILIVFAFSFSEITAVSTLPTYFLRRGFSENFVGFSVTALMLPIIISQPLVGICLDRLSKKGVSIASALAAATAFLIIPLVETPEILLGTLGVLGIGFFSLNTCALTLLGQNFTGAALIAGTSAYALTYAVGSFAGASLGGVAMETSGLHAPPIMAGLLLVLTAIVLIVSIQIERRLLTRDKI